MRTNNFLQTFSNIFDLAILSCTDLFSKLSISNLKWFSQCVSNMILIYVLGRKIRNQNKLQSSKWSLRHFELFKTQKRNINIATKRKRRRSDSVLWQKTLYQQTIRKPMDNTTTATKNFDYTTIADRLSSTSHNSVTFFRRPNKRKNTRKGKILSGEVRISQTGP